MKHDTKNNPQKNLESSFSLPRVKLKAIDLSDPNELDWLHSFIHSHHSSPEFILPGQSDLQNPALRFFKAIGVHPKPIHNKAVGITSYEVRTPYLAETQKLIIDPKFRGMGLGKILSAAIEAEVKKAGFHKIRSCIYSSNLVMLQIKLKQGYTIEGYHPDHDGPRLHEYSLGKMLKKDRRRGDKKSKS